ncbi:sensor domain-containing diguanylate cyclase [Hafnia alvei]|uniref:diguanylate cyclase n=1 Tax=Hafnia alvei TaxID=569 RepID=A0A1C6Z1I5_HAFAL|nr:sensor domain-containing diguanylate cyclase [Hafnia alvei]SCM52915.1 diguanylate cyclase (GGDEF) domain-containing protein [Hafnia alvei]
MLEKKFSFLEKGHFLSLVSFLLLFCLFVFFVRFGEHRFDALRSFFPVSTAIVLVLHMFLTIIILIRFHFNNTHLHLIAIASAYGLSSLFLANSLFIYPGVLISESKISESANALAVDFVIRSFSMAALFLLSVFFYIKRKCNYVNKSTVAASCAIVILIAVSLAVVIISNNDILQLPIIETDELNYRRLWSSHIGNVLIIIWVITTFTVVFFTKLVNGFWFSLSLSLSCLAFLGSILLMWRSEYVTSLAWYGSHLFEVLATLCVVLAFIYDIYKLYQKGLEDYLESYENSIRDSLTHLYDWRYFNHKLASRIKGASEASPISLFFIDIDHFKSINDGYGHPVGDKVIRHVADTMVASVRKSDVVARYGGEEFAIILKGLNSKSASRIAENIRNRVSEDVHVHGGPEKVTVSIGVYTITDQHLSADEGISRADTAMYQAKKSGRNCVVIFSHSISDVEHTIA